MRVPVRTLTASALLAAVLCVLGPLSIPLGPIPLSLCTLGIYLFPYLLGCRWTTVSVLIYVLLGAAGLPVFTGFTGGLGKLMGPTGGYIVGYLFMSLIIGWIVQCVHDRRAHFAAMLAGTAVLYAFGTAWYCFQAQTALGAALALCALPFIPGDLLKMGIALWLGPVLRGRLEKARLV